MVQQVTTQTVELAPTFAQALVVAVAAFSAQLGALNTARGGVTAAADSKVTAQTALASAEQVELDAVASESEVEDLAVAARDAVVVILQAWAP